MVAEGETRATTDHDVAAKLASDRVADLEDYRRHGALLGTEEPQAWLGIDAAHHRREVARRKATRLATMENRPNSALEFIGVKNLQTVTAQDV